MFHRLIIYSLGGLLFARSHGLAATNNSLDRSLAQTVALTNSLVVVTANFTNGGTNALRGFYYADQLPAGLQVTTVSVKVNGLTISNYTFECGLPGDVYPDRTPYRWILERPINFTETNPIPPQATAQIVYTLTTPDAGTFPLQPATWVGVDRPGPNTLFGFDANVGQSSVSFLIVLTPGPATLRLTNNHVILSFATETNVTYYVDYKADLNAATWLPLTNCVGTGAPWIFEEDMPPDTNRFYRVRLP